MATSIFGNKIFFIHPHSVVQDKLIDELINREYEVYLINDHRKIESICEYYTAPIIFINIDEGLKEPEWDKLIRYFKEKESTNHARFGILTYNDNAGLSQKYLMDIMVTSGFIKLKLGLKQSTEILVKTLEANEVKGNRKYVRAQCEPGDGSFNVYIFDKMQTGHILDISSVGMTVHFENDPQLAKNSFLPKVQLKLKGILLTVDAVVLGFRKTEGEKTVYVFMFESKMPSLNRSKIRTFIRRTLQKSIEKKLKLQTVEIM